MSTFANAVSIHPYFQIHEGQKDAAKAMLQVFIKKVKNETGCLYYNFTFSGDILFCREAYKDAEGVQAHLANVGEALGQLLEIADLIKIEIHGPAGELELLRPKLADLNPTYFISECGVAV